MWGRLLRVILIALVLYLVVSRFLASTYRIESVSMEPALHPSDRVIVSSVSYGPRPPFTSHPLPGAEPPLRGDLVVVQPPFVERAFPGQPHPRAPVASFFTLQKATLHRDLYGGTGQQLHGEAHGRHSRGHACG